jgi:Fe-S cluster assembly iron-binding protein IscA
MLQVTDSAATIFRGILDQDDVDGSAIRLAATPSPEPGRAEISFLAVEGPHVGDVEVPAAGVQVYVEPKLADELDDAVLDAQPTQGGGASFSLVKQAQG